MSEYLATPVTRDRIRWSYAGVRPLYDDGASKAQEATRDYVLGFDAPAGQAPLLSVFGGKITTYRRLAEEALSHFVTTFPHMGGTWTKTATLPGGDIGPAQFEAWERTRRERYPFLDPVLLWRLCRAYGTRVDALLADVDRPEAMGIDFGAGLSQREVDYLIEHEWAETAEDILWRRSKLGLHIGEEGRTALAAYLARR